MEFTVEIYDKIIAMMRSSNPEDFSLGLEIYKKYETSGLIDILLAKSFGGSKRVKLIAELNINVIIPTIAYIDKEWNVKEDSKIKEIINRIQDEYSEN